MEGDSEEGLEDLDNYADIEDTVPEVHIKGVILGDTFSITKKPDPAQVAFLEHLMSFEDMLSLRIGG